MKKSFNSKFFRVLLMLFMLLSFSFSALAENIPANTTLYLDAGEWNKGGAGFAAYFFDNGEEWVSMTQVSGNIFKVTSPNKNFPKVIFARMNSANATGWGNKWNQTKDITDYTSGKNLCTITDHWNGNKASWIWSTYSAEDTGEGGGGSSTSLPTSKGDCQKIEIYSKDNYRLYVFDGSHVGPEWGSTEKGAQVEYDGSTYYKWTICSQDKIQIIFQNGDRSKQSGDSPVLYGGYAYFFENVEVVVNGNSNPVPKPTAVKAVDCTTSGTCYNSSGVDEDIDVPELPTGLLCDATYKKTLFFEDFGTLAGEKSRKQNNTVDAEYNQFCGAGEGFVTSYNFVDECVSIKNAGEYAIVVNPKYSGCSSKNDKDYNNPCYCGDSNTGKLWYKDCLDHTEGDVNGGMLQFDSRDGNSKDVLYQRTLKNVCANTFLNFSAWITKANNTDADPIKARFILRRGGADGEPIGKKDIDNINVNDGWVQIFAMFNTGELNAEGEITVQLINLAKYGQFGNDILLDDLELTACLPLGKLVCSDGVSVVKTINYGETEELTASLENGLINNPYYYWQYKTARSLWQPFFDEQEDDGRLKPKQGLNKMVVKPEESSVQYRVIIANNADEAMAIASEMELKDACGMGAITNEVTINTVKNDLIINSAINDGDICVNGTDANTLTLTLENPRLVTATDVKVALANIDNLNISKVSGTGSYDNGVWEVGDLTTEATVSIVLSVKSSTSVSAQISKTIGAYVSAVDSETYASIDVAKSKTTTTIKLNPIPDAPAVTPYSECATSGTVALSTLASGTSLKFYSDEALSAPVTDPFSASTVVTNKEYYVTQTNTYGCTSPAATVTVTVKENPTLSAATLNKTAICATDANSKATVTYNISGGLAPYTLYIDRTEGGVTETINENVSGSGTRDLKPSSDATYKFTKVVDANGCESTSNKTVYIDVQEIKVTSNISDEGVCADKQIEYNITATGDNINYKWFESTDNGVSFNEVGTNSNTYTTDKFAMGDTKQYKVVVSQNSKVCSAVEGLSKVKVNDCSGFEITYKAETNNVVCEGGIIKLKLTLTNNSTENASDVQVLITNIANQTIVSRNTNLGASYTHDTGMWIIPSLASGATATLTLEIEGVTIVKDLESKAYVVRSGSTTYTEATTKALATQKITVKDITAPPTLIPETYKGCPVEEMLDLSTQVSSDDTNLKFYTTETGSVTATRANKNTIGTTSYWVSNTKEGECESPRTKLDITVYPQPTAKLTGDATICNGEPAYLAIKLSGTPKYTVTYAANVDGTETDKTLNKISDSEISVPVYPTTTTTYALKEVIDGNSCKATLTGNVKVVVNDKAEISISAPEPICAGDPLDLTNKVTIVTNGSTVINGNWYLDDAIYTEGSPVLYEKNGAILKYKATSSCGGTIESTNSFAIIVKAKANITITAPADLCIQNPLQLQTPTINYNGSTVTGGKWYLDGEEYNGADLVYKDEAYTLQYKATSSCGGETKSNEVTFKVKDKPTINLTEVDLGELCAGTELNLPTVTTKENNSTISSQGWLLETSSITSPIDALSTDVHDGKTITYTATNECGTTKVDYTTLSVKDCADFTLTFDLDNSNPCSEDEVTLTATITNNGGSDLSNVVLSLQGPNAQASVTSSTSGDIVSNYSAGVWTIPTFTSKATATLTIKFSAQTSEELKIHVSESNGVSYASYAESPAKDTEELVVKEISDNVEISDNYIMCPTESSSTMFLSDFVISNQDGLKYFDKNADGTYTALTSEPTFDTSLEFASHTYYITNTETGKCESTTPTPITIEIYKPVKASISGLSPLCSGETSNVSITLEGTPEFTVVYNNGTADITQKTSETTLNIAESLSSTTTYKLVSVTDINNCSAYLNGIEFVTVTVNPRPELVSFEIEDSDDIICEGESTNLKATFTGTAPFTFKINGEEKTSDANEWSMTISDAKEYVITDLSDANCSAETISNNSVTLTVDALPVVTLSATDVTLNCTTPTATITASGAYKYEWSYLDQTGATQTKSGSTLALQQTDPEVSSLVTEYTVYGYSENANCQSVEAKTVKVTEDFVKPVASIKVSERTDGTIQEWLDCNQETIKLEADITLNTVTLDKYIWSDGSEADNTIINKADTYTLQVVGKNGCKSEVATKTIAENIIKPQVSIDSYVKDPITGEIATQTKLTCTNKEITLDGKVNNADEYSENYPNGEFTYLWSDGATTSSTVARTPLASSPMEYTLIVTAPNGCDNSTDKAKVTITEDVTQPVLDIKEVYELCPSDTLSAKTLSSLLPKTSGITYKFYDESDVEIADLYKTSTENYYVVGVSENGCESNKTLFSVDLAKNVDFTLQASQTSMLVGGNETVITIVPDADSDEADTYTWQANGNEIAVDGLEYSTNLYLDTKFEVTAINRCDSKSQEVSIEVLWPTAFTPHNDNGKNDDFAKGMPIIVFNRFYTKIFEGPDGWDGTINGTMNDSKNIAVPGVYYYKVDLPNGEVKKGTIEIVR